MTRGLMALAVPARTLGLVVASFMTLDCGRPVINNRPATLEAPPRAPLTELWSEPQDLERRNLLWGSAPADQAPSKDVEYEVRKRDTGGYSDGYDVVGPDGREWDIKVGKEAQTLFARLPAPDGHDQVLRHVFPGTREVTLNQVIVGVRVVVGIKHVGPHIHLGVG